MAAATTTEQAMGLEELFAEVLDVDPGDIDDSAGPESLESWTSRAHFELITAMEEVFGVVFSQGEIQSIKSVGDARRLLGSKGVELG